MSKVQFTFDGTDYHGNKGEPLSAALLRNGIKVVTESSYLLRPRGVVGLGYEEPCALVRLILEVENQWFPPPKLN